MNTAAKQFNALQVTKLILPREHGSWSLVLEPLALGLLAAPSVAGVALAFAALAGFFLRCPLKFALHGRSHFQSQPTMICVLVLIVIALASLSFMAQFGGMEKLWPLAPAAMAGIAFMWFDSRNEAREGAAELSGAIAFGILPAAFGALAGWSIIESIALAAVMLARAVPTVLFVRTYLRLNKNRAVNTAPALFAAVAGLFVAVWLVFSRIAPWPTAIFVFMMTARTILLLRASRPRFAAKTIGIAEAALGATMMLTVALAWKNV